MVRLEGNISLKNPVTPPGIDPGTVRLVAQRPVRSVPLLSTRAMLPFTNTPTKKKEF